MITNEKIKVKSKKIGNILNPERFFAGILVLLLLLTASMSSNAQTTTTGQQKTTSPSIENGKASTAVNPVQPQKSETKEGQMQNGYSTAPYYNYKGITDIKAAKEAWIADHPEEYKKISGNSQNDPSISPKDKD